MKMNNARRFAAVLMALLLSVTMVLPAFASSVIITEAEYDQFAQSAVDQLYQQLMHLDKYTVVEVVLEGILDEQFSTILSHLTADERTAYTAYVQQLFIKSITQNVSKAGPFMPAVDVSSSSSTSTVASYNLTSSRTVTGDTVDNGLILQKTALANKTTGSYTVTLEAYTTGSVTTETTTVPVDIVLVLDQSNSMKETHFKNTDDTDGDTYQQGLADAFETFVKNVVEKYNAATADHRIAVVTFNSNGYIKKDWTYASSEDAFADIQTALDNGTYIAQGTRPDYGMAHAVDLMGTNYNYNDTLTTRQKVVIMFSDGVPSTTGSTAYTTDYADDAISYSKTLKDSGVTVYSIGIFQDADPTELYGTESASGTAGEEGYTWTSDYAAAANRYLNYLSSNSSDAANDGLDVTKNDQNNNAKRTYKITENYNYKNSGYYLDAHSSEDLSNVFTSISNQISTPSISLGETTVVQDVISPYFTLPANADSNSIKTYTALSVEGTSWANRVEDESITVSISDADTTGKTLQVTGFDFNANFVSEVARDDFYGKKLIIEFEVVPEDGFLGGNNVITNASAGVYTPGENNTLTQVELFGKPTVDVPLKTIIPTINDDAIYLSNEVDLKALLGLYEYEQDDDKHYEYCIADSDGNPVKDANDNVIYYPVDGVNNQYVTIKYTFTEEGSDAPTAELTIEHGATDGDLVYSDQNTSKALTADTTYTVTCTVTPYETGTYDATSASAEGTVYVYKPVLTFQDSEVKYKSTITEADADAYYAKKNYVSVVWTHANNKTVGSLLGGTEPELTLTYSPDYTWLTGTEVTGTKDVKVNVTNVKAIGDTTMDNVTAHTTSVRNKCECTNLDETCNHQSQTTAEAMGNNPEFVVHIYDVSGDLTITKTVVNDTAFTPATTDFTFTVTLTDASGTALTDKFFATKGETTMEVVSGDTVTLEGGESITIQDLPADAKYTVVETEAEGFVTTMTGDTGTIVPNEVQTAAFTNTYQLGSITINKVAGEDTTIEDSETFTFTVTGNSGDASNNSVEVDVVVYGAGSATISGLPFGSYIVSEDTNWSNRYAITTYSETSVSLTNADPDGEITVTNTNRNQQWLDSSCSAENVLEYGKDTVRLD